MAAPDPCSSPESPAAKQKATAQAVASLGWLESRAFSWFPYIGFGFMVYTSINAVVQSKGDSGTVAFVVGSFGLLGGLFFCMRAFEKAPERASAKKGRLKVAIWGLAMALNALFSYRVTVVLDSTFMTVTVWAIAAFMAISGCYLLFFYPNPPATPDSVLRYVHH